MKKLSTLICAAILTVAVSAFAAEPKSSPAPSASAGAAAKEYTCPMHSDVVKNKPGKCPKCGMKLEPKKEAEKPQ